MRIQLLGGFRVAIDTQPIPPFKWRRKPATLVKALALAPGHRLHRERIMDLLWPLADRDAALNSFHQTLRSARHTFEPHRPPRAASKHLVLVDDVLALISPGGIWLDVEAF